MRTKESFKNLIACLLLEGVLAISGFIVPRFFVELYGSTVNGLVSSISQFISYMTLVEAGIGAAGTVALYGPLANKNYSKINEVVSAAKAFYFRSGWIFVALVAALISVYPFIVKNEIADASFVRMMIFILSVNGIVDYFFLGKYRVLLMADQKGYVIYIAQIIGTVFMTVVSVWLIECKCSAIIVKGVAALVYLLRSVAVAIYVKKAYPYISFKEKPDMSLFSQRWSALVHQIVTLIVNNTAVVLMTIMLPKNALVEISVYSVYNLVGYAMFNLLNSISNGVRASFGQVIANNETDVLKKSFSTFEYLFQMITFFAFTCMGILLFSFVDLYSSSFTDGATYTRWSLVILFTAVGLIQSIRLPSLTVLIAAGHYHETQTRAIAEAAINLVVSIMLIRPLGVVGVLIGALSSYLYRTTDVLFYSNKHFVPGTIKNTFLRIIRNGITMLILIFLGLNFLPTTIDNWLVWLLCAVTVAFVSGCVFLIINFVFEKRQFMDSLKLATQIFNKKINNCKDVNNE